MSRYKTPDSISHMGTTLNILVTKKQKQMVKELSEKEDSSMNRYIRRLIERNYEDYLSKKYKNKKIGGEHE
jgi:hypothetical protein